MSKLELYKTSFAAAMELLDTAGGAPLEIAIGTKSTELGLNEQEHNAFKSNVTNFRQVALQHRRSDEVAAKQAASIAAAKQKPAKAE